MFWYFDLAIGTMLFPQKALAADGSDLVVFYTNDTPSLMLQECLRLSIDPSRAVNIKKLSPLS